MMALVLLISSDLACVSKVTGAAARAAVELRTAMGVAAVEKQLAGEPPGLVLVDLSTPGIKIGDLVATVRAAIPPNTQIIAFGPHVHTGLLAAAREAGCDRVVSRGEFHARIDDYLEELTPPLGPKDFPAGE
jgi:CheY-like chemotaxis protein